MLGFTKFGQTDEQKLSLVWAYLLFFGFIGTSIIQKFDNPVGLVFLVWITLLAFVLGYQFTTMWAKKLSVALSLMIWSLLPILGLLGIQAHFLGLFVISPLDLNAYWFLLIGLGMFLTFLSNSFKTRFLILAAIFFSLAAAFQLLPLMFQVELAAICYLIIFYQNAKFLSK